jgi:hypothetical protein
LAGGQAEVAVARADVEPAGRRDVDGPGQQLDAAFVEAGLAPGAEAVLEHLLAGAVVHVGVVVREALDGQLRVLEDVAAARALVEVEDARLELVEVEAVDLGHQVGRRAPRAGVDGLLEQLVERRRARMVGVGGRPVLGVGGPGADVADPPVGEAADRGEAHPRRYRLPVGGAGEAAEGQHGLRRPRGQRGQPGDGGDHRAGGEGQQVEGLGGDEQRRDVDLGAVHGGQLAQLGPVVRRGPGRGPQARGDAEGVRAGRHALGLVGGSHHAAAPEAGTGGDRRALGRDLAQDQRLVGAAGHVEHVVGEAQEVDPAQDAQQPVGVEVGGQQVDDLGVAGGDEGGGPGDDGRVEVVRSHGGHLDGTVVPVGRPLQQRYLLTAVPHQQRLQQVDGREAPQGDAEDPHRS